MQRIRTAVPVVMITGLLLVLVGCGGGETSEDGDTMVTIEKGERSPAIEGAKAVIQSPDDSAVLESPSVQAVVDAESFETGVQTETDRAKAIANSGNGQHFHLILDNQPYMANYEAGVSFDIGTLDPGAHTLFAFPSRSYHESVKGDAAYDYVNFYVGEKSGEFMLTDDDPAIIYSRPKGTYSGDAAKKIMLDFYLHNVELSSNGYRAQYTVRSGGNEVASITLTEWAPAFMTGLSSGTYEVNLQLLDEEGNVVPGPFNDTTREIQVQTNSGQSS